MLQKERVRDNYVAVELWALCENTHFTFRLNFIIKKVLPALPVELMPATQRISSGRLRPWIELTIANLTCILVFVSTRIVDFWVLFDKVLIEFQPNFIRKLISNLFNFFDVPVVVS